MAEPLPDRLLAAQRARDRDPARAEAHLEVAEAMRAAGRTGEALASYDAALAQNPALAAAQAGRQAALADMVALCDGLIARNPGLGDAHAMRGSALLELGRTEAALESFTAATAHDPRSIDAHYNRGVALQRLAMWDEAVAANSRVLALSPNHPHALNNRGQALQELGSHERALEDFDAAIRAAPDFADAHVNRAMTWLLLGRAEAGWREYEWRFGDPRRPDAGPGPRPWRGTPDLRGRRLWLHAEQGLGDTIQFARYAKQLGEAGVDVVLSAHASLTPLFAGWPLQITSRPEPPEADFKCPLLSLPLALAASPDGAAYLEADPARRARMAQRLGPRTKPRVGLVWSGSAGLRRDRQRSIPFDQLGGLLSDSVEWHSLQLDVRASDRAAFEASGRVRRHDASFADTAALVDLMDLVISVDTSLAHLAGAMGKPVWLLLSFNPDWRWGLSRSDSPWYASARLCRQPAVGDWRSVIDAVRRELDEGPPWRR